MCDERRGYVAVLFPAQPMRYSARLVDLVPPKTKTWWEVWKERRTTNGK